MIKKEARDRNPKEPILNEDPHFKITSLITFL